MAEVLYHYTCEHSAKSILAEGELHGNEHPLMPEAGPIIWLTDMEVPDRLALGLTSRLLRCDRTAHRFAVRTDRAQHWPVAARRPELAAARRLLEFAPGVRPAHWWVVLNAGPLPVLVAAGDR